MEGLAGFWVEEDGRRVAPEHEIDVIVAHIFYGQVEELFKVWDCAGVGVIEVEGWMDEEVKAGVVDGKCDLFGPPDVGTDHDGFGGDGVGEKLDVGGLPAGGEFGPGDGHKKAV